MITKFCTKFCTNIVILLIWFLAKINIAMISEMGHLKIALLVWPHKVEIWLDIVSYRRPQTVEHPHIGLGIVAVTGRDGLDATAVPFPPPRDLELVVKGVDWYCWRFWGEAPVEWKSTPSPPPPLPSPPLSMLDMEFILRRCRSWADSERGCDGLSATSWETNIITGF